MAPFPGPDPSGITTCWQHSIKSPKPCFCGSSGLYRLDCNSDWSTLLLPPYLSSSRIPFVWVCVCARRRICVRFVSGARLHSPNTHFPSTAFFFSLFLPFFILGLSVRLIPLFPFLGCQLRVWSHFLKAAVPQDGRLIELWPFSEWVKNRINA